MAVCRTLKTKKGISKFLLNSEFGDESMAGFQYENEKVEVHALRKECAPLYFDDGTTVNSIHISTLGTLLIATTSTQNTLEIGLWDINNTLGFTPKEILHENKKEKKYKFTVNVNKYFEYDYQNHLSTTVNGILVVVINGRYCLIATIRKPESSNTLIVEIASTFTLPNQALVIDCLFLEERGKVYLILLDSTDVIVMDIEDGKQTSTNFLNVSFKISKATGLSRIHKVTHSKCLIIDNLGYLHLFSAPNTLVGLKFPTSIYGHGICAVVGFKHTTEGILAVCNENHTINLYLLADIICSVKNGVSTFVKPYRVLCSQYPINSMTFVRNDQLAMASSSNELILFWGGLANNSQ